MKTEKTTYAYLISHWNGCSYSSDGEEWVDIDGPDGICEDELIGVYRTDADGEPCDVRLICEVTDGTEDEYGQAVITRQFEIDWSTGEDSQDECTIIASDEGEYDTSYVGTRPARYSGFEYVKWTNNGGIRGAHDRMTNDGWRETYDAPEEVDAEEFLRLVLDYGYDLDDDEHDLCSLIADTLRNGELDSETDTAYALDGTEGLFSIEAHGHRIGSRHVLLWTDCDGAGVDDVTIRDWSDDCITEYAEEIASNVGEAVDVESGGHYSNLGHQYQPSRGYDRDGYEIIIKRRN